MSKTLIILPGWSRDKNTYKPLIAGAPEGYRLIVASYEKLMPNGQISEFEANFSKFIQDQGLDQVGLIGSSLGGPFAIDFTFKHPDIVTELFLLDAEGVADQGNFFRLTKNFFQGMTWFGGGMLWENFKSFLRILGHPIFYLKLVNFANTADYQVEAAQIKAKTTIIWSKDDIIVPLWQGQKLHELIKGSKLVILEGVNHDWMDFKPELFWKSI